MKGSSLVRFTGILAIIAGFLYILIQFIHPSDDIMSVGSNLYQIVAILTSIMSFFFFLGILGIYLKQVTELGWLGLFGTILFGVFWLISMIFSFTEAFILPLVKESSAEFVRGMTGLFSGYAGPANLGIFPTLTIMSGLFYIFGGLIFGFALLRAKVVLRCAAILLMVSSVLTLGASLVPHPFDRVFAIPMGLAFIWLGYIIASDKKPASNT